MQPADPSAPPGSGTIGVTAPVHAPPPASPVVIAVPHAGRDYPPPLLAASRLAPDRLVALEDRYADLLVAGLERAGAAVFVATRARAWIDLNRDSRELDPAMLRPAPADALQSSRVRSGLGLVPRRIAGAGEIYAGALPLDAVRRRIADDHAPWHAAIAAALAAARARFGVALLVDVHSMPPLGAGAPTAVLGDRFGRSAGERFVAAAERALAQGGFVSARNSPYAGGYTLDRHGRPEHGIHALQIEFSRACYLDAALREPGDGLERTRRTLAALVRALAACAEPDLLAAE